MARPKMLVRPAPPCRRWHRLGIPPPPCAWRHAESPTSVFLFQQDLGGLSETGIHVDHSEGPGAFGIIPGEGIGELRLGILPTEHLLILLPSLAGGIHHFQAEDLGPRPALQGAKERQGNAGADARRSL